MRTNIITLADSYKYSHYKQYPENMVSMFDYASARSGKEYPTTIFFGLQYYINEYLMNPFIEDDIVEAKANAIMHGIPFNEDGWRHILDNHQGFLPVEIKAVREGSNIPTGNVLFTIESTDEKVPWVPGFLETLLMKVWYTSNIATRSFYVKKMLKEVWKDTVDPEDMFGINFAFHNFGDRGSSSVESAGLGSMAQLTQFMGTDNFDSLRYIKKYYNSSNVGFSIPATEHSTTTAWGKKDELKMLMAHLEFNKDYNVIAAVCDSYDYLATVKAITSGKFKRKIESPDYPKFIIRPDSGDPVTMIQETLNIMEDNEVAFTMNSKGYKVFNKYGILWGDGIDIEIMDQLLWLLKDRGYSAQNIVFGSGGWLMQQHDRDTQSWAVKCSSITVKVDGNPMTGSPSYEETREVFKDPITSPAKKSMKGKLALWYNHASKEYFTDSVDFQTNDFPVSCMTHTVYKNGSTPGQTTFEQIKEM